MFEEATAIKGHSGDYIHVPLPLIEKATAKKVSGRAISVLLTLATHMDENRRARVSLNTLTATLNVSHPTVINALRKLAAAELIEIIRSRDEDGGIATNVYVLKY